MSGYRVCLHESFADLQPQQARIDELARGNPFLCWDWLETWWLNYGQNGLRPRPNHRLLLLSVWEQNQLIGLAPWYLHESFSAGRVIRSLGSGETCGDYLTILSDFNSARIVAEEIAVWLWNSSKIGIEWDQVELTGVLPGDFAVNSLCAHLVDGGCWVDKKPLASSWRIDLSEGWESYLSKLSKSHRKDVRRVQRSLESGEFTHHRLTEADQFDNVWHMLVDLHTRRRQSLGDQGCFASTRFHDMHQSLAKRWLSTGNLELTWVAQGGEPLAVEYQFRTEQGIFAYQSGIDPTRLSTEPGRISMVAMLLSALERGITTIDLLRGDEPYKPHWRAEPRGLTTVQIVHNRTLAKARFQIKQTGSNLKRWIKMGWQDLFGNSPNSLTNPH
jgi:hypothetical protein